MLLGASVAGDHSQTGENFFDARIKAGSLLSVGGLGGDALSDFGREYFPHLNVSNAEMITSTLVMAGEHNQLPLTTAGPAWFTDAYTVSPRGPMR